MKYYPLLLFVLLTSCAANQSVLVLYPQQSMSVTGLGPGQDAAYNPFADEKSMVIVENISASAFQVRIQQAGEIREEITVNPNEQQAVVLESGYEVYLDAEQATKAQVTFKRLAP